MAHEFSKIARLRQIFRRGRADVMLGIGDDAALWSPQENHGIALSCDAAIEGVHFQRAYACWQDIGYRACMAATSDLAAMAATLEVALVSLSLCDDVSEEALDGLAIGIAAAADELGGEVIGGNLTRSSQLAIHTAVMGRCPGRALRRAGARPGDRLYVSGTVGDAALGLRYLQSQPASVGIGKPFVDRWRRPSARIELGLSLADRASAAIDISDGLLQDLSHLCDASQVGARVTAADLPLSPGMIEAASAIGEDARSLALCGGEDYELLFASSHRIDPDEAMCIGEIVAASGIEVRDECGLVVPFGDGGFRHW